jgi:hypothetical protein
MKPFILGFGLLESIENFFDISEIDQLVLFLVTSSKNCDVVSSEENLAAI